MVEEVTITSGPAPAEAPKAPDARPDYIPEKFWDAEKKAPRLEEMAKSYSELEKKIGKPADPAAANPPAPAATEKKDPPADPAAAAAQEALAAKKIDFNALTQEYGSNGGKLSEASYKKLEDAGIPKNIVDDYIATQAQKAEAFNNEVFTSVGGKDTFMAMTEWAKSGLTPAEVAAYNASVEQGPEQARLAVAGLHSKYIKATGGQPNLVGGRPAAGVTGYRSLAEQQSAMQDPRYNKDAAYREEVTARALASSF